MGPRLPLSLSSWLNSQCPKCHSRPYRLHRLDRPHLMAPVRPFSTTTTIPASIAAAPEFNLSDSDQPPPNLQNARLVPASPSYFTGQPAFTDSLLSLRSLLRRYQTLPTVPPSQAPRVAWRTLFQFRMVVGEPVRVAKYHKVLKLLHRLNRIDPDTRPSAFTQALEIYKRDIQPYAVTRQPKIIDLKGRASGVGRRKSSSAKVFLVRGDGEVLVNGKSINSVFGRIHDRESALWALKITHRLDKYNVWAFVKGGGSTGQAEAITLGTAKALMVHEPALKPVLRRGKP
jgi:small subunit ribosomal protein S9